MKCIYCGAEINEAFGFCPKCGKKVDRSNEANTQKPMDEHTGFETKREEVPMESASDKKSGSISLLGKVPLFMWIALGVVAFLLVLTVVLSIVTSSVSENTIEETEEVVVQDDTIKFGIYHEPFPGETDAEAISFTGSIFTDVNTAHLTLNGELLDTVTVDETGKTWGRSMPLTPGINSFVLTLSDGNGQSVTEHFIVNRVIPLVYQPGTTFIKLDSAAIYIRPTPAISDKYVIKVPANDYTSRFVCVGMEHTDAEGYLWCKVTTPLNGIGWVRTDLIKAV